MLSPAAKYAVAQLYLLADHLPAFKRELQGCAEEIEANDRVSKSRSPEEVLLAVLGEGYAEEPDIIHRTGIKAPVLRKLMERLEKQGRIVVRKRGGKTEMQRGRANRMYLPKT